MPKKHCFLYYSNISFLHFLIIFYPSQSSSQILGLSSLKSKAKLRDWGLNAEEVRCQPSPSLKDQIRFTTGSKIPLFTFTKNLVIPSANHCSDPQCMCTRIWILIGHLCFHFQGTLVQEYWDVLRNLEGKGIPYLWLEYCLGPPKQTISLSGVN